MDCCDVNGLRGIFRGPLVRQESQAFEKRGLNRRQRRLVAAAGSAEGAALLEIGCGIAAPSLVLLQAGADRAELVDISFDYLEAALRLARERGLEDRVRTQLGDFVRLPVQQDADIVLLDRVVCCYPDARALLERAARSSKSRLVLSYPKRVWWMRLFHRITNFGMSLCRKRYRFYLHSQETIHHAASSAGHALLAVSEVGPWHIAAFEKARARPGGESAQGAA